MTTGTLAKVEDDAWARLIDHLPAEWHVEVHLTPYAQSHRFTVLAQAPAHHRRPGRASDFVMGTYGNPLAEQLNEVTAKLLSGEIEQDRP